MATNNTSNMPVPLLDGQLIIGKTSDRPQVATLTAGTNITITNGAGTITINSSGGGGGSGGFEQIMLLMGG
jgi:trimeric autotransporter adhesin